jgi:hypothetical protein
MRFHLFLDTGKSTDEPRAETTGFLWPALRRICVSLILLATLWIVIGSAVYPLWWFEFIFKRGFTNWPLYLFGFGYLFDAANWLLIAVPVAFAGIAFFFWKFRGAFVKLIDGAGPYIVLGSITACALDAYILNKTQRDHYELDAGLLRIGDSITQVVAALAELGLPPSRIDPPVDFLYVDAGRVARIYTETEPSLREQRRTLSEERKKDNGVDLDRKPLTAKLGGSTSSKETREFRAIDPSTTRKCLDLMNGLLERPTPPYYATYQQLHVFQRLTQARDLMKSIHNSLQQPSLFLIQVPNEKVALLKQMNEINKKENPTVVEKAIRGQLGQLSGLIIVQGDFDRVAGHHSSAEFREQFKAPPNPIYFHFRIYDDHAMPRLPQHGKRLVLGNVIQRWDGEHDIELNPLAIF